MGRWPGDLRIEGDLSYSAGMRWHVSYRRAGGNPDESGGCSGYATPEDAAYACLTLIEQGEREAFLEQLVIGVA